MPHILYRLDARRLESMQGAPLPIDKGRLESFAHAYADAGGMPDTWEEACVVAVYHDAAEGINEGRFSMAEACDYVCDTLRSAGFLMDCFSRRRFILDNVVMLSSGCNWHEKIKNSTAYPAQRLLRIGHRNTPRDWEGRWRKAYAQIPLAEQHKAHPTDMVAANDCAIWCALSRWNLPYPPFDFCSGMGVQSVDFDEANDLGILVGGKKDSRALRGLKNAPRKKALCKKKTVKCRTKTGRKLVRLTSLPRHISMHKIQQTTSFFRELNKLLSFFFK